MTLHLRKAATLAALGVSLAGPAIAAPVTVPNYSFELPNNPTAGTTWTNALNAWTGTNGNNNALAFIEYIAGFKSPAPQDIGGGAMQDDQHIGMEFGYDIWQDLAGVTFQANTLYTLTAAVGNRTGSTDAGNNSIYALADPTGVIAAQAARNASTNTAMTFADGPPAVLDTFADPNVVGKGVRVLLQARGAAGRSHFDNIRLDAAPSAANGRPAATLQAPTAVTSTTATFNGTVTSTGSANPTARFYYGTTDGGGNVAAWESSVTLPGTHTGAFSRGVTGLAPSTTYFVRARVINASGEVWAVPGMSFTTVAASPVVDNGPVTNITGSSATVSANVVSQGGQAPDITIYYGTADGGTNTAAWAANVTAPAVTGSIARNLTALNQGTRYYYRTFGQNAGGSDWADATASFDTLTVTAPSVENQDEENVTGTSAVLRGAVTSTGGGAPVVTLFWGTTDGGTNPGSWTNSRVLGTQTGDFASLVQGLNPTTTYFFTSRAVNAAGTAWASSSQRLTTTTALPASVIINEIHYDPADNTKQEEFIELHNPTGSAIDLSNWIIDSGVDYVFPAGTGIPAGGYRVVVQNMAAFGTAFPSVENPLGPWTGRLSNSGESIRIRDAARNTIDEVDYRPGFPWPTGAKGTGVSAELLHPSLDNGVGGNWRSGAVPQGAVYVPFGSQWRWRRGVAGDTGEPATPFTAWRLANFVEPSPAATNAQWATAPSPFGFGENDGVAGETENVTRLTDMTGGALYTSIYLRKTFTIPAGQMPSHVQVSVKVDDGCLVWINGQYVGAIRPNPALLNNHHNYNSLGENAPEPPPLNQLPVKTAASLNLVEGENIIAVHALNTAATSSDFFIDAQVTQSFGASVGVTPGGPNVNLKESLSKVPPAVRDVMHTPAQPVAGDPVVISATITDSDNVGTVSAAYQAVEPGTYIRLQDAAYNAPANWTAIAMNDAGTGGDLVAGDGVFSATIPGSVQTHRRLIRYRITAADTLTNSVTVPYPDDEQPNFAYFVYNGMPAWTGAFRPTAFGGFPATTPQTFPASLISGMQSLQLIALDSDVAACLYTGPAEGAFYRGTMVYDGKVYDHITFNVRGIGSTRVSGKNKLAFKFNRARDFEPRDNWGRRFQEDWNSFGLDANASPWAAVHRGSAGVEDALSYRVFELAGMASLRTTYAQLRIIRKALESPPGPTVADPTAGGNVNAQYATDLWGLYLMLEPTEGNFLDERGLPDGNIYAIEGNTGNDKKHQGATQSADAADWNTYRTQRIQNAQTEAWYRENMDLPNLYNYIALSRLTGNVDVRDGDNYRYYHRSSDNRWVILGYDHDMQFIAATHWVSQQAVDGVVSGGMPHSFAAIKRHPAIAQEYRNRCRELLSLVASDGTPSGGQIGQLIDEYAQMVNPSGAPLTWADLDANMWNIHPRSAGGGANNGQTNHRGNFFRATFTDARGAGNSSIASNWLRHLPDPDGDGFSDHEGLMAWLRDYATNTYPPVNPAATPPVTPWTRRPTTSGPGAAGAGNDTYVHRQKGYGYKYLEWESNYGGHFAFAINPPANTAIGDLDATGATLFPVKPVVSYTGAAGFPVNGIKLHSSDYSDPQGPATISAVQFRVGEISAPGLAGYDPSVPRIYEVEELWRSAEIPTAAATNIPDIDVPGNVLRAGHTYRARVRHKDNTGRWSYWSEPLQFVAGTVDVAPYTAALRISEINYNPGALTVAESMAAGWNPAWNAQELEFIEVRNVSAAPIDLTNVRFTKGIDFDFPNGFMLAAGASTVAVKNPEAFAIRYPGVTPAGSYGEDSLANSGEEIKLSYGAGAAIIEFAFTDASPWPESPDGDGPTLVLRTPGKAGLNHGDPAEWTASAAGFGTPGSSEGGGGGVTYAAWAAAYPGLGGPNADDDKDGLVNRLEYALAGDPRSSSTSRLPVAGTTVTGGQTYATLTFVRRTDASEATLSVQFSGELMTWNLPATIVSSTPHGDGTTTEVWRSSNPVSGQQRLFGRVTAATP